MTDSVNFSLESFDIDSPDQIEEILHQKGYKTDYFSNAGDTMLHLAAKKGDLEAIQLGIAFGLNREAVNKAGNTFLHLAAEKGHLPIVEYCFQQGDALFANNHLWQTPFHLALKHNREEVLQFYYNHTPQLPDQLEDRLTANGYSPTLNSPYMLVESAVKKNDLEGLKEIHQYMEQNPTFCTDIKYWAGGDLLKIVARKGNTFIFDYLLKMGIDINDRAWNGPPILQEMCKAWNVPMIEFILSHEGIRCINERDNKGWAPLHYAAEKGHLPIVKRLIELGADVNLKTESQWYDETDNWTWDDWDAWADAPCPVPAPVCGPINPLYSPVALARKSSHSDVENFLIERGGVYFYHPPVNRWY